ncbi:unnamed protein product [Zymoseptoria tritici ST99CH_1A5]|uniref:Uncharacterized protein n=1 Tax=Zymoseptoria tritici ST99CH_1A5 TaxID=1276529 RepID=A0A1Y6LWK4_ZYMTR|nr:unnamed protein product [Zymoseptoria tritici ST99CH_1A5]
MADVIALQLRQLIDDLAGTDRNKTAEAFSKCAQKILKYTTEAKALKTKAEEDQKTVDNLAGKVDEIKKLLDARSADGSEAKLQAQLQALVQICEEASQNSEALKEKVANFGTPTKAEQDEQIETLGKEKAALQSKLEGLQSVEATNQQNEGKLQQLQGEINRLKPFETNQNQQQGFNNSLSQEKVQLDQEIRGVKQTNGKLTEQIDKLKEAVKDREKNLKDAKEDANSQKEAKEILDGKLKSAEKEAKEWEKAAGDKDNRIQAAAAAEKAAEGKLAEVRSEKNELMNSKQKEEEKAAEAVRKVTGLETERDLASSAQAKAEEERKASEQKVAGLEKERDLAKGAQAKAEKERKETGQKVAGLEMERDVAKGAQSKAEKERKESEQRVAGLEMERDLAKRDQAKAEKERDGANSKVTGLESERNFANNAQSKAEKERSDANSKVTELETIVKEAREKAKHAEHELEVNECSRTLVDDMRADLGRSRKELTAARGTIGIERHLANEAKIDRQNIRVENLELQREVARLQQALSGAEFRAEECHGLLEGQLQTEPEPETSGPSIEEMTEAVEDALTQWFGPAPQDPPTEPLSDRMHDLRRAADVLLVQSPGALSRSEAQMQGIISRFVASQGSTPRGEASTRGQTERQTRQQD